MILDKSISKYQGLIDDISWSYELQHCFKYTSKECDLHGIFLYYVYPSRCSNKGVKCQRIKRNICKNSRNFKMFLATSF